MKRYIFTIAALSFAVCGCVKDEPFVKEDPVDPAPVVTYPSVYINEISTGNKLFEVYNAGTAEADITGFVFRKDESDTWTVPAEKGKIPAKGFVVYKAKQTDPAEGASFGLSGTKGFKLELFANADLETLIDMVDNLTSVTTIEDTETYGRRLDGSADWVLFSTGTMGSSNAGGVLKDPNAHVPEAMVVLNELHGNDPKFIELYNAGDADADLTGWQMFKDGEAGAKWIGPEGMILKAGEFIAFDCVKQSTNYSTDFGAGFSAAKNVQIILVDAAGNEIDRFERGTEQPGGWGNIALPGQEYSFSRVPDGTGDFVYADATKGEPNGAKKGDIEQE